jgi:hypothetical protein
MNFTNFLFFRQINKEKADPFFTLRRGGLWEKYADLLVPIAPNGALQFRLKFFIAHLRSAPFPTLNILLTYSPAILRGRLPLEQRSFLT